MADAESCGSVQRDADPWFGLRIGAIFVILVTSLVGTLAPIVAKRSWRVPTPAFDFVKYFGSGVIVSFFVVFDSPSQLEPSSSDTPTPSMSVYLSPIVDRYRFRPSPFPRV